MTTPPDGRIRGGLRPHAEAKLERLAALFAERAGGVTGPVVDVAREICVTHPEYAPACWKLFDIWYDDGAADPLEALANYRAAGDVEATLLALDSTEQRLAIASSPEFRTRSLALRLLVTDERLWHERPQSTLVTSQLALWVSDTSRCVGAFSRLRAPASRRASTGSARGLDPPGTGPRNCGSTGD